MATTRIVSGRTSPGEGWKDYNTGTIYIDVDTSALHLNVNPVYVTSIGGGGNQFALVGGSSVYNIPKDPSDPNPPRVGTDVKPLTQGFRIYISWVTNDPFVKDHVPLDPGMAVENGWYINWVAIESHQLTP